MSNEALFQISVKAVVRNRRGEVLVLHATPDEAKEVHGIENSYWDIPGGRVSVGEKPDETLVREAGEETGLSSITQVEFLLSTIAPVTVTLASGEKAGIILFAYTCLTEDETEVKIGPEHDSFKWCSPQEASQLLTPNFPAVFVAALAQLA